jgi:hypothetical protein
MTQPERLQGVWITAFEVTDFVPGATTFGQATAIGRPRHWIEIDRRQVERLAGRRPAGPSAAGYLVTFIGRRTRAPMDVGCQDQTTFGVVVDRLLSARWAGEAPSSRGRLTKADLDAEMARLRALPVTVAVRHGGEWGSREAEAVRRCARDKPGQTPGRSSPPGNPSPL